MSAGTPLKSLPRYLDPRKLAQQGAFFHGSVPVSALPRLSQAVETLKHVEAKLSFALGEQSERVVQGEITADIELLCQRCLEPLPYCIESDFAVAVVWTEEETKHLPSIYDPWIAGEGETDVYEMVEEELLLSLPVVAYHEKECIDPALFQSGAQADSAPTGSENPAAGTPTKPNPFQVLTQLKGNVKK